MLIKTLASATTLQIDFSSKSSFITSVEFMLDPYFTKRPFAFHFHILVHNHLHNHYFITSTHTTIVPSIIFAFVYQAFLVLFCPSSA